MKLQEIIIPMILAYLTLWSFSYFWSSKDESTISLVRSGQEFNVMRNAQMCFPVNMEVDFNDAHKNSAIVKTSGQGYNTSLTFISGAGVIDQVMFKRHLGEIESVIETTLPAREHERESGLFLLALTDATPYNFELMKSEWKENGWEVTYQSTTPEAIIQKIFFVHSDSYQIDLLMIIEPLKGSSVTPRLFVPGPYMKEIAEHEKVSAVVFTERQSFKKFSPDQTVDVAWASPRMCGIEDRYFAYVMIADSDKFTQRAYFKRTEGNRLTVIFEGPETKEKTEWKLSFYCGPKELKEMTRVDTRLDELMDYGWLAPVSKMLLHLLNYIYSYVGNYGWAIIIITLLMRILLFPFVRSGNKKMKHSAEMNQKMRHLEQKYKNDPEALREAQMELARKQGFSMFSGCLPLLIQVPVFIGLNFALRNAIELYKAPFALWIHDLSAPDPYYVLPAFMAGSIFMVLSSTSKDPRYKVFSFVFALITIGATAYLSSGLALFICISSATGLIERRFAPIKP